MNSCIYVLLQRKWAPMHLAARNGHVKVVNSLIKSKADIYAVIEVSNSLQ